MRGQDRRAMKYAPSWLGDAAQARLQGRVPSSLHELQCALFGATIDDGCFGCRYLQE